MCAVHIRIRHDNNFIITQLCNIKVIAVAFGKTAAESVYHRFYFRIGEHLVNAGLFHVQDFAPDRQDGLIGTIPCRLCTAARGISVSYTHLPWAFLAGMYLLPLLYGLFLRYTSYRDIPRPARIGESGINKMYSSVKKHSLHAAEAPAAAEQKRLPGDPSLFAEMQNSIVSSLCAIASLGGYMILFNLLNLIPEILLPSKLTALQDIIGCILEITSGLSRLPASMAFWGYVLLPFGGLSCICLLYTS